MLRTRTVCAKDVLDIFNKPWYATAVDIIANGLDELSPSALVHKITVEYSHYYGLAVVDSVDPDKVLAIMGACKQDGEENIWWTWFFAPHDFQDYWREVSDFARKIIEDEAAERGVKEVRAYSPAGDTREGIMWFKRLGFHKAQNFVIPMNSGHNIFMFQRFFK